MRKQAAKDKTIYKLLKLEEKRQKETLQMIPSENYTSKAILNVIGSVLSNKYSEGYPEKRYYQGNNYYDLIENLTIQRAKDVFNVEHVNVQPYSGSPANAAVYFALLERNDKILGMSLPFGGHLTHGHPTVTLSGKYFKTFQYKTDKNGYIDYKQIDTLAKKHKPKIIISGTSAYPRKINFKKIGEIADKVGAYHLADISHIAGLVAGGAHPSPSSYAHIITTTTHKTLRGPRGAMIMVTKKGLKKDPKLAEKIDKAVFPGLQGGPHNNTIAGIAIALKEASSASFKGYAKQVVSNSKTLSKELKKRGFNLLTNGSDNHLILVDITNKLEDGWYAAWGLEYAGIITNRNAIPFDKKKPFYPSGIRIGTPAITTIGMKEKEMFLIAKMMSDAIDECKIVLDMLKEKGLKSKDLRNEYKKLGSKNTKFLEIRKKVKSLMKNYSSSF